MKLRTSNMLAAHTRLRNKQLGINGCYKCLKKKKLVPCMCYACEQKRGTGIPKNRLSSIHFFV